METSRLPAFVNNDATKVPDGAAPLEWRPELVGQPSALVRWESWWDSARQTYPKNTQRAWAADWVVWANFCREQGFAAAPASVEGLVAFVVASGGLGKKPATVRRYLATIARVHKVSHLPNPMDDERVTHAVRRLTAEKGSRQRQAKALGWREIARFIETAGQGIRADRERALLCVAYYLMARRSELVALNVEDLTTLPDGTGRLFIRQSKTDQAGEGFVGYLPQPAVAHLQQWLSAAGLTEAAMFRRLHGRRAIGKRLHPNIVGDIFKRVAQWVGMSAEDVTGVSGHSVRVGAAQDLLEANEDLPSVMQAGRWKTPQMLIHYGEGILAGRGAMARLAAKHGGGTTSQFPAESA